MPQSRRWPFRLRPSLSVSVLLLFLAVLWIAGGASRADVPGQVLTRGAATIGLIVLILLGRRPALNTVVAPTVLLACMVALVAAQLVPLPFGVWSALPGRAAFASFLGSDKPWMPLTLAPAATWNALYSLLVPALILIAVAGSSAATRRLLLPVTVAMVFAAGLFGMFQFSIGYFNNPLVNNTPWQVSGQFANRNHFALFMAFGCLLVPAWAFYSMRRMAPSIGVGLGLTILFLLMILSTGSRAGLVVGGVGLAFGLGLTRSVIVRRMRRAPRWLLPAMAVTAVSLITLFVMISVGAGRAASVNRLLMPGEQEDMRSRALPTVIAMIRDYFPFGSGVGGFDTVFRMHEPFDLLKRTYFNHAHGDFAEILIDAGLPGFLLLIAALGWWAWASVRAWRAGPGPENLLPKLGSAMLLLVFLASIVDYPARTPLIMAMIVIAAVWLSDRPGKPDASALPTGDQHL
jgi:O-antigen ligase